MASPGFDLHQRQAVGRARAADAVALFADCGDPFGSWSTARRSGPGGLTTVDLMPEGRDAEVACGGRWAQARWRAGRRPTQAEVYAVLRSTGCRDDTVLRAAGGSGAGVGIVPLLTRCWAPVVDLAERLYRREVTHRDVCRALGLPDDGGPGSVELAMIRSGCAPGTFTVTRGAA